MFDRRDLRTIRAALNRALREVNRIMERDITASANKFGLISPDERLRLYELAKST